MPLFKKEHTEHYLLTNYKVMYSFLSSRSNLEHIPIGQQAKKRILLHRFYLASGAYYFMARNPFNRIESFFKDKFRKATDYYERKGNWQTSQMLFFPYLGIDKTVSPALVKRTLLDTSFAEMIQMLPELYEKDRHLVPQNRLLTNSLRLKGIKINHKIRIARILKIESREDMTILNKIFNLDTSEKRHSTESIDEDIIWSDAEIAVIESLYNEDFKYLNYSKKSNEVI